MLFESKAIEGSEFNTTPILQIIQIPKKKLTILNFPWKKQFQKYLERVKSPIINLNMYTKWIIANSIKVETIFMK